MKKVSKRFSLKIPKRSMIDENSQNEREKLETSKSCQTHIEAENLSLNWQLQINADGL